MRLRQRTTTHHAETAEHHMHDKEDAQVTARPVSKGGQKKEAWQAVTMSPKAHQKDLVVTPEKTATSPRIVRVPTATPRRLRRTTQHSPSAQLLRLRCYLDDLPLESIHIGKPSSYEDFIERIATACQCDVLRFATTEDSHSKEALGVYLYFPDIGRRRLIDAHLYHDMILLDEEMEVRPLITPSPVKKTTPTSKTHHQKGQSQQSNATSFSARHRFLSPDPEEDEVALSMSTEGSSHQQSGEAAEGHRTPERASGRQTSHLLTPPSGLRSNDPMSTTLSPPPSPSLLRHRHQTPPQVHTQTSLPSTPPRLTTPPPRHSPVDDPLATPPRGDMAEDGLTQTSFASSSASSAVKRTAPSTPPSRRTLDGAGYKTAALAPPGAPKPFSRTRIVKNLVPAGALHFQKGSTGVRQSADIDFWERSYKPPGRNARNGSPTPLPRPVPRFP